MNLAFERYDVWGPKDPRHILSLYPSTGGGTGPVSKIRQAASNTRIAGFSGDVGSNGTDTTANFVSAHWNDTGKPIAALSSIDIGWVIDAINESDWPDDFTVSRAYSYPFNTTLIGVQTWGGLTSKTILAGSLSNKSDKNILSSLIPTGAKWGEHVFLTCASGKKFPLCGIYSTALGERKETGVGLTDKTQSLNVGTGGTGNMYRAAALLVEDVGLRNSGALNGDSLVQNVADVFIASRGGSGAFGRAAENRFPVQHMAVLGTKLLDQVIAGKFARRLDLMAASGVLYVICDWAINDLGTYTAAQIITALNQLWTMIANKQNVNGEFMRPVHTTISPSSTSPVDKWNTLAGQIPLANYTGSGSKRGLVNAYIRSKPAPLYDYLEVADALEPARDDGRFNVGSAFSPYLEDPFTGTVQAGATTTSIPTNLSSAAPGWAASAMRFTTGALASSTLVTVSSSSGSTLTTAAWASAPAAGDQFTIYRFTKPTPDGLHWGLLSEGPPQWGGTFIVRDALIPQFTAYAAA